ncbi:MAG: flagellin [Cyanobacteria bacterium]|nr:flagellin [Cyanobacteriota bacterium]
MISINTNTQSLFAQRALGNNTFDLQKSIERLSTGYRINRAGDDAAGLSIAQGLTSDIKGFQMAKRNIGDGISAIQTAEGAVAVIQDNMQRIRELVVQGLNGTNSADEADALQREINERVNTIDEIAQATKFNGITLLYDNDAATDNISLQTGTNDGDTTAITLRRGQTANVGIEIDITQARTGTTADAGSIVEGTAASFVLHGIHLGVTSMAVDSAGGVTSNNTATVSDIDQVIDNLSRMRSYLGAVQNSLESKSEYTDIAAENAAASLSRIQDVDVASESSNLVRNQILQQTAGAMLAQANNSPQIALSLLP